MEFGINTTHCGMKVIKAGAIALTKGRM